MSGDEWKGGGHDDYVPFKFFGLPPEKLAELQRQQEISVKDAKAVGDLTYASLPMYREGEPCAKCGGVEHKLAYTATDAIRTLATLRAAGDHPVLTVTCRRCRAGWHRKPLDAGSAE